jgi:hypothetical protein
MTLTLFHEMPHNWVATESDRRWNLRSGSLADGAIHAYLVSARAPEGATAIDLVPERIELMPDQWDGDEALSIPAAELREFMEWPPS